MNDNKKGPYFFLLSVFLFSTMELLVKFLSNDYPTGQIVFARGLAGLIPIFLIM